MCPCGIALGNPTNVSLEDVEIRQLSRMKPEAMHISVSGHLSEAAGAEEARHLRAQDLGRFETSLSPRAGEGLPREPLGCGVVGGGPRVCKNDVIQK